MATRGYHRYRGRGGGGGGGKIAWIIVLVLILMAAIGFLLAQRYVVFDETGKPHFTLFDRIGKKQESPVDPDEVVIDRGDDKEPDNTENPQTPDDSKEPEAPTPARRKLKELHATQPEYGCLWWTPDYVLSRVDEAMVIEVKRPGGGITFGTEIQTPPGVLVERGVTRGNLSTLLQGGKYAAASMCCFVDPAFARSRPETAITMADGRLWYDAGGRAWLDPAGEEVQAYLTDLCRECAELGFQEIVLDEFCYPTTGNLSAIDPARLENRTAVLSAFAQALRKALPEEVALSVVLRGDMGELDGPSGLSAELLACFDRIYLDGQVDAEMLRQILPEDFDTAGGLVLLTRAKPESGGYVLLP